MSRPSLPAEARRGLRDAVPILLGVAPFGLVAGATAVDAGLSPLQAAGLSVVVFAGASQLAAIELLGDNAELLVVLVTGVVINLRILMYSASIAPHFRSFRSRWKAACAYVLTDQAYALSVARYTGVDLDPAARRQYHLAVGGSLWVIWQVCTLVGIVVGARVPPAWGLEFAVPLVFLSLLVPATTSWPKLVAAAVGGGVAVAGAVFAVPLNLGLIAGGVAGVIAGVLADERLSAESGAGADGDDAGDDTADSEADTPDTEDDTADTEDDTANTEDDTADTEDDTADTEDDTADTEDDTADTADHSDHAGPGGRH